MSDSEDLATFNVRQGTIRNYTFTFTNITSTDGSPDTDTELDLRGAKKITIQVDSTAGASTATDWDLNIMTSAVSGGTLDTTVYNEKNFGNSVIASYPVTPGPNFGKVRVDENLSLRADITVIVSVEKGI